jgi:hypothetical protein
MWLAVFSCMTTTASRATDDVMALVHPLGFAESASHARDHDPIDAWCAIVRTDFDELPDMRLSVSRASQLWSTDGDTCRRVFERLVTSGFLVRGADGCYGRADHVDGAASSD